MAEGGGLLNRCTVKSCTGGSNPPLSARFSKLLYLLLYSPHFNPTEQAWSKIKQLSRTAKHGSSESRNSPPPKPVGAVTVDNTAAWFNQCGYGS